MAKMGSSTLWGKVIAVIAFCGWCLSAQAKYAGGTGEPNDPYQIATPEDLNDIGNHREDFDKHFILVNDVNLAAYTNTQFKTIGIYIDSYNYYPFTGVFDGNGHRILHFTWKSTGRSYIGLFGFVGSSGQIRNLCVENVDVNSVNGDYIGGLVGRNDGTISICYSSGKVTGTVDGYSIGGLVGWNYGEISSCYSTSDVTGDGGVGGLVGINSDRVINCYSTGSVTGDEGVGGLIGSRDYGTVTDSFWDVETSDCNTSAGGTPKTTAEMKMKSTFTDAGWEFVGNISGPDDKWAMPEGGGYPILWWQLDPLPFLPAFSGGSGTPEDPYIIASPADLNSVGHNPRLMDKHFVLVEDVNISQERFYIIGNESHPFMGVFDGNNHRIWNFKFTYYGIYSVEHVGLFGYVGTGGQIRNIGLENVDVNAVNGDYVGGLVGGNYGQITNSYSVGIVSGYHYVGGLVGANYEGTINSCYSTGVVSGGEPVGGLLGMNWGTIINCYSSGSVAGVGSIAGLVGKNYRMIINCYSIANVSGSNVVGGLVGGTDFDSTINNCHSTGTVSGVEYIGGLVGYDDGAITDCYSTGYVSGRDCVGGLVGDGGGILTGCYSTGSVSGRDDVGGLVGYNHGPITDCFSTGNVTGTRNHIGGLAGRHEYGLIADCYSTCSVIGNHYVGGFVGGNDDKIDECYSIGSIVGNDYVGGLVGGNSDTLTNCYSTGSVDANYLVGGLVGYNSGSVTNCYARGSVTGEDYVGGLVALNTNTIADCYSTGSVSGMKHVGGLVGWNESTVTASFWDTQTSGQSGSDAGTPKTTAEMRTMSTFIDAGWDFVDEIANGTKDYWRMCIDSVDYPLLSWQFIPDFTCPDGVNILDLAFFVDRWLADCDEANNSCNCTDINHDAQVDFGDFAFFSRHWLQAGDNGTDGAMPLTLLGRADTQMGEPNSFAVQFVVVGKQRLHRTLFEYQCQVILTNLSPTTFENVWLVMMGWPDNMTMIDPRVIFGDAQIGPGESATSIDTCIFTVERSEPINPVEVIWHLINPADMAFIPGGTFQMGDSFTEGESGERPVHTVTLDSFYMGKYEITNQQYCDFLNWADDNGWITVPGGVYQAGSGRDYPYCHTSSDTFYGQITYSGGVFSIRKKSDQDMSHYPIVNVTWYGAAAYCNWRSQQEGREQCYNLSTWNCDFSKKGYRLPTEAEWEYAARGGLEGKRFPWGDTISHSQANYISHWEGAQPYYSYDVSPTRSYHPTWNDGMYPYAAWVGFFAANGYGLYDMAGNAQELCNDWYSRFYYSSSPVNNPRGPTSGASRALRGGSWYNDASYSRVAKRSPYGPIYGDYSVGFRVARAH